jgi:molybdate transport system substrate-binding protein
VSLLRRGACLFATALLFAGCTGRQSITVFAASSLTEAFNDLARLYEEGHPGVGVDLSFAASSRLAAQITNGAPADVFASADLVQMASVVSAGYAADPAVAFARNVLAIAVEPGNPLGIRSLSDLARPDLVLVLAAAEVPAGRYARRALDAAGITVAPASLEATVKGVVSKVSLGEADAGIVYRSDIGAARGAIEEVAIPASDNVAALYPIVVLREADDVEQARAFVAFVLSPTGLEVMQRHGFGAP